MQELNIIFWMFVFLGGYLIIFFFIDIFIDNLKLICIIYKVSPFIIGSLIVGIDPEELIASTIASISGLPYVAIGNVIGNQIIAQTLCFSLPALFFEFKFESVPKFYFLIMYSCLSFIIFSFLIPSGLFIFGIICLSMYFIYFVRNLRYISKGKKSELYLESKILKEKKGEIEEVKKLSKFKIIILVIISLFLVIMGGEILIYATSELIKLTHISESIFGFVIIAFTTNVEELTLIIKSIKKNSVEIGIGGMMGKLIWNLTLTFGISGIIISNIIFNWVLVWNWGILIFVIFIFYLISRKKLLNRKDGIILAAIFIIFLILNIIFPIKSNSGFVVLDIY